MSTLFRSWVSLFFLLTLASCYDVEKTSLISNTRSFPLHDVFEYGDLIQLVDSLVCQEGGIQLEIIGRNAGFLLPIVNRCSSSVHVSFIRVAHHTDRNLQNNVDIIFLDDEEKIKKEKLSLYALNPNKRGDLAESPKKAGLQIDLPLEMKMMDVTSSILELAILFKEVNSNTGVSHDMPILLAPYIPPPPPPPKIIK